MRRHFGLATQYDLTLAARAGAHAGHPSSGDKPMQRRHVLVSGIAATLPMLEQPMLTLMQQAMDIFAAQR